MTQRGVILQTSYRVLAGVPVVHLFGRLEDGRSFLVRDGRDRPFFYIGARHAARAAAELGIAPRPVPHCSLAGDPLARIEVMVPGDVPSLRDRLHAMDMPTFEADVRFAQRYLIDRDVKGACEIVGTPRSGDDLGVDVVFDEPELRPLPADAAVAVTPRVLSFDIETDPREDRLLAISLYGLGADEVLVMDPAGRAMPERANGVPSEAALLRAFAERVTALDPDVLTGWNVIDFDLMMLARTAARVGVALRIGRGDGEVRIRAAEGYFGSGQANVPGRLVLDGIDLLRGAFVRTDDYSLDAVARSVLGEGKAVHGDVADRVGEILSNYRNDLDQFALYARTDARLALEIVEKLDLVTLAFARSRLTGMTPDRVAASIASFDFLYLSALGRRRRAAPTVGSGDNRVHAAQGGGHVLEPVVGLHQNVWVFDFKSLYPSIIRTFNIDPLGYVAEPQPDDDLIVVEDGAAFRREGAILPAMLDDLFPRREAAKRRGDAVASQAIKILMNSFYGVLGTPACRFHNPAIANAITGQGRHLLLWSKAWFEARGYAVLYGDTDSLFVGSGLADGDAALARARTLAAAINNDLRTYVEGRWRVQSALELEFEKLYVKLILPSVRHGAGGARKRYAGLTHGAAADAVEFVGMEVVRRDWTELAKRVQRELYQRLFAGAPVDDYLRGVVAELRAGKLDDLLVYRKGLRKSLESYTASTPPHVAAARQSSQAPGRVIRYLMTVAGPQPLDALTAAPDREHYLERQVRPVAEPVLQAVGLEFERVIGDDRQLGLF
ncbi:MAG: DNA polymerase II [Pseudomonadales bacterium]